MNRNELVDVLDRAAAIEHAPAMDEITGRLRACLERFDFSACLVTSLPHQHDKRWYDHVLVNEWPTAWYQRYTSAGHYRHDPCAARCRTTADPFVWSEARHTSLFAEARLVMDEAGEFGLREGICIPIHAPFTPPAVVTVAGEAVDLAPATTRAVHILALHAYRAVKRILAGARAAAQPRLSGREREILQWVAAGKTAWEASRILSISESTVHTHLRNAKQKLDTVNIVHAVVEALRRQEIQL